MIANFSDKHVNSSEGPRGPSTDQELPFPLIVPRVAFCSLLQMVRTPHHFPLDSSDHPEGNLKLSCHTASHPATQHSRPVSVKPRQWAQALYPQSQHVLSGPALPVWPGKHHSQKTKVPRADSTELSSTRVLSQRPGKGPRGVMWGS